MTTIRTLAAALLIASLAGCKKEPPPPPAAPPAAPAVAPTISTLTLGKRIDAGRRIMVAADTFGLRDTIYVSVGTDGAGENQKLKAVWTFGSEVVRADSQVLNLSDPATSEFHISRARPWPAGNYRVTVTLNNGAARTRNFVVAQQ